MHRPFTQNLRGACYVTGLSNADRLTRLPRERRSWSGIPPSANSIMHTDDTDAQLPHTSPGMSSIYLDAGDQLLFPFGCRLSCTTFDWRNTRASTTPLEPAEFHAFMGGSLDTRVHTAFRIVDNG